MQRVDDLEALAPKVLRDPEHVLEVLADLRIRQPDDPGQQHDLAVVIGQRVERGFEPVDLLQGLQGIGHIPDRTGIGVDEAIKEKIFEPFYSTKKEGEGTGLGLSTVYGIVKQNNGIIHLESETGVGTIFEIYWPVTEEQQVENTIMETEIQFNQNGETGEDFILGGFDTLVTDRADHSVKAFHLRVCL